MGIQINPGHGKGSGNTKGAYMRLFSDFFISGSSSSSSSSICFVIYIWRDYIELNLCYLN